MMIKSTLLTVSVVAALSYLPSVQAADPVWQQGATEKSYEITVYHSPTCGCCKGWVDHLKDHNFKVKDVLTEDVNSHKVRLGVPQQAASCHTAVVNGKVIEGHVPAKDIKALLASNSDIKMLAVPGMPSGGPGMDFDGARKDAFKVFAQTEDGKVSVFNEYTNY